MSYPIKVLILSAIFCAPAFSAESVIKDKQDMDCYVYTPDVIDPAKTYQVMVGVHGARGNGKNAAGLKNWAERGDVIVIGPSFDTKGGFQGGDGVHAEKLINLFETLKKTYKLNDQMFLYGFSAGSQFTHRFAMLNPKWVCGVSAHSGGSWATDGYGEISTAAKKIPFAISCGENDTQFSVAGYPYNRLDWYKHFKEEIDKKNFCYIGGTWPGVGHSVSAGVWDLTKQCFQLATDLPGESATVQVVISDQWKNLDKISKKSSTQKAEPKVTTNANSAELDKMVLAAFKKADAEKVPDDSLIVFMKKYPPVLWKDKPGSAKLLEQCKGAAELWYQTAKEKNMLSTTLKEDFARFTEGLNLSIKE